MERSEIARYTTTAVVSQTLVVRSSDGTGTHRDGVHAVPGGPEVRRSNCFSRMRVIIIIVTCTNKKKKKIAQKLGKVTTLPIGLVRGGVSHKITGRTGSR